MSGANGTRTRNPLLAKQVRYQLRHSPKTRSPMYVRRSLYRIGDFIPDSTVLKPLLNLDPSDITNNECEGSH